MFDSAMVAFGVRNFQDLGRGLEEIRRVLRPGGRLIVLEFSQPKSRMFTFVYLLYTDSCCRWWGGRSHECEVHIPTCPNRFVSSRM